MIIADRQGVAGPRVRSTEVDRPFARFVVAREEAVDALFPTTDRGAIEAAMVEVSEANLLPCEERALLARRCPRPGAAPAPALGRAPSSMAASFLVVLETIDATLVFARLFEGDDAAPAPRRSRRTPHGGRAKPSAAAFAG